MQVLKKTPIVIGIVALLIVGLAAGSWAVLRGTSDPESRGTCGAAIYQFEAEEDDGIVEVAFELTSAGPGEVWDLVLSQDDTVLFEGQRTTDEDGEIDVDLAATGDGRGEFVAEASDADGAVCSATLER